MISAPLNRYWLSVLLASCGCSALYRLNTAQCETNSDCVSLGAQFANTSCVEQVCVANRTVGLGSGATGGNGNAAAGDAAVSLGGAIGGAGVGGASVVAGASGGGGADGGSGGVGATGASGGAAAGGTTGAGGGGAGAGGTVASGGAGTSGAGAGGAAPIQLALGKTVTASSEQTTAPAVQGNDGDQTTLWCAKDGTFPQWWRVDLGASHTLDSFAVTWGHPDRTYSYKVETSTNDRVYTLQATVSGIGTQQSVSFPAPVSGRYVRITVTDAESGMSATGTPYTTFACFYEFTVQGS